MPSTILLNRQNGDLYCVLPPRIPQCGELGLLTVIKGSVLKWLLFSAHLSSSAFTTTLPRSPHQ